MLIKPAEADCRRGAALARSVLATAPSMPRSSSKGYLGAGWKKAAWCGLSFFSKLLRFEVERERVSAWQGSVAAD